MGVSIFILVTGSRSTQGVDDFLQIGQAHGQGGHDYDHVSQWAEDYAVAAEIGAEFSAPRRRWGSGFFEFSIPTMNPFWRISATWGNDRNGASIFSRCLGIFPELGR